MSEKIDCFKCGKAMLHEIGYEYNHWECKDCDYLRIGLKWEGAVPSVCLTQWGEEICSAPTLDELKRKWQLRAFS